MEEMEERQHMSVSIKLSRKLLLIVFGGLFIIAAFMFGPMFFIYGEEFNVVCQVKLDRLNVGFMQYLYENGCWPEPDKWGDQIKPYIENEDFAYKCMKDKVGPCSYAMNQMFPVDKKNFSHDLVLLYESRNSGWNMSGGPDDILIERHKKDGKKGCIILFADGGRKFIKAEDIPSLRWTVEEE